MCIRPWAAIGASQEKALSMRSGVPSASTSRSSGAVTKPSGGPGSGVFGVDLRPACRPASPPGGAGFGKGRLVAKAARHIDRAEQDLQQVEGAAGLEAVGMGRDAAHRMHRDRAAEHRRRGGGRPSRSRRRRARSPARRRRRRARRRCAGWSRPECRSARRPLRARHRRRDSARRCSWKTGTARRPSGKVDLADELRRGICGASPARPVGRLRDRAPAGAARDRARTGRHRRRLGPGSPARAHWCSGRDSRDRPCSARSSSWISARTNSPSVPGRMPIHSSAIAE